MAQVTVYGAASTQPVLDALISSLQTHHLSIRAVHASSATLARQIELGAPDVDVFISANVQWMDYLDGLGLLEPNSRRNVATNRLVLIAAADVPASDVADSDTIVRALEGGRMAIADPDFVPAGIYGREALIHMGAWEELKDRLAPAKDVTGALLLVARGEARLGIVYESDVRRVQGVHIHSIFPAASHTPIVYQAAAIKNRTSAHVQQLLDLLSGAEGQAAFRAAGFGGAP